METIAHTNRGKWPPAHPQLKLDLVAHNTKQQNKIASAWVLAFAEAIAENIPVTLIKTRITINERWWMQMSGATDEHIQKLYPIPQAA